ncbi:MAG: BREX-1 system phosphatase PglZ type B [Bacteroidetes bacterium]|nr:BREX-1 system phosphatase PglZ type B [Bacteroidota bacterium]
MKESVADRLVKSLRKAGEHNSQIMVPPKVILWPDPEKQWESIIDQLQTKLPQLMVFGEYAPEQKKGPAIWLKCMIDRKLPEADWSSDVIPIIYLPRISKRDFRNAAAAELQLQPLIEYQYTGNLWLHENGKEWTVAAFIQNQQGLGVQVEQDTTTKETLISSLPRMFNDRETFLNRKLIDADFLLNNQYPNAGADILKWMEYGDAFFSQLSSDKKQAFKTICHTNYNFEPDPSNIKEIALKLGTRNSAWERVWEYFSHAPGKYPKIQEYLRLAKPDDLGKGMFAAPKDSWPQFNEEAEEGLRKSLLQIDDEKLNEVPHKLKQICKDHTWREHSVWAELGQAPLLKALEPLQMMAEICLEPYPSDSLNSILEYYSTKGFQADLNMREALSSVEAAADIEAVTKCIRYVYKPWLEKLTEKFQSVFSERKENKPTAFDGEVILFVDALRFDVAKELKNLLEKAAYEVDLESAITAIPTLTPTAKVFSSPIAKMVDKDSSIIEFRPSIQGKDLSTDRFRKALSETGYEYAKQTKDLVKGKKYWLEIGTIDTKGHDEQAGMVKRIPEMLREVIDVLKQVKESGVERVSIVTDHGWLLLPGGLPKAKITKDLTETRWGRCAQIKEGASVELPHFSWTWNPGTFIAYAPGISFFKANVEYAHGGISPQECVVPRMNVKFKTEDKLEGKVNSVSWNQLICHVELSSAADGFVVDIRTRTNDADSSIVLSKPERRLVKENKARVMVDDSRQGDAAHVVLLNAEGIILDSKLTTVGG